MYFKLIPFKRHLQTIFKGKWLKWLSHFIPCLDQFHQFKVFHFLIFFSFSNLLFINYESRDQDYATLKQNFFSIYIIEFVEIHIS